MVVELHFVFDDFSKVVLQAVAARAATGLNTGFREVWLRVSALDGVVKDFADNDLLVGGAGDDLMG
jgi:hypothetical protein